MGEYGDLCDSSVEEGEADACAGIAKRKDMTEACVAQMWKDAGCTKESDHGGFVNFARKGWGGSRATWWLKAHLYSFAIKAVQGSVYACQNADQCSGEYGYLCDSSLEDGETDACEGIISTNW